MKTALAFLVANLVFSMASAVGAGVALALGALVVQLEAAESTWLWLVIGYSCAGAGIAFTMGAAWLVAHSGSTRS
jgi:hypothetical protein